MSFLTRLFGNLSSSGNALPTEQSNLEIPQGWSISEEEFADIQTKLSNNPLVSLTKSKDPMDDKDILVLSIAAAECQCEDLETPPFLVFRSQVNGLTKTVESYFFFEDKFFWGRGANPTVRLRFDTDDPETYSEEECGYGTTKASLHFNELDVLLKVILKERLLLQVIPVTGYPLLAKFDLEQARDGISAFATAVLGRDFRQIGEVNPAIVNFILRYGPQNTFLRKRALSALGFNPGPLDYTKDALFFDAAQRFAESRMAYEIVGAVYEGIPRTPWHAALYQEAPARIKSQMGPLKIFD